MEGPRKDGQLNRNGGMAAVRMSMADACSWDVARYVDIRQSH